MAASATARARSHASVYRPYRIEYDITVQLFAVQDGVCEHVPVCVRACAVEIKLGVLRVSLMYTFRRSYCLPYKMATFIAAKGLFNPVYSLTLADALI